MGIPSHSYISIVHSFHSNILTTSKIYNQLLLSPKLSLKCSQFVGWIWEDLRASHVQFKL